MRANSEPAIGATSFLHDAVWIAVSRALVSLTSLVILPALTKSYGLELYGVWMQVFVTVGLLHPVLTLHLGTAMVRFLAAQTDREKRRQSVGAMLYPTLLLCCLSVFASFLLREHLSTLMFADTRYASFVPLAFLWASAEALLLFLLSYLRATGRIKRLSFVQIAVAVTKMALIMAIAGSGHSLGWVVACLVAAEVLFVATLFLMVVAEIGFPRPNFSRLTAYLTFSIPLLPSGLLIWVISYSDRYFITHLLEISQTGIYSASYTLGGLISLFYVPLAFVLFPTLSKLWEHKELAKLRNYLEYSTKLFLTLGIPAAAGLCMISQPLLWTVTTPEFATSGTLVLLIAVGTILFGVYQMNVYVLLLVRQTRWLPVMTVIAAATNASMNMVLIPELGIMGAAVSTIVSYFLLATIVTVWARRAISYRMDFKFLSKVVAATLVMAFCLWFIRIDGAVGILLAVIIGVTIFTLGFLLLRPFSKQDKVLIMETLTTLNLWARGLVSRDSLPSDHKQTGTKNRKQDRAN